MKENHNINKMPRKRPLTQVALENNITQKRVRSNSESDVCVDPKPQKRAGTVNQMTLRNFMCHSLLEVNLRSNINYIIGRNGSGKSAILTALVVGLGAKATITNRGSSIKSFVKAGKNSASIEIRLCNKGPLAYRHSVYGNEIIIQRNFSAAGSSWYKIKSASGAVVSSSCKEIQRATSALNIQVDNPVCILNQDTSRNFLSTSDPKQKFSLFMKATRLETLFEEYKSTSFSKKTAIRMYREKERVFEQLKLQVGELKRKIENHRLIFTLKDKLTLYQRELLWAKVRDSEEELHTQEAIVEKLQQKYEEMEDNSRNRVQKLEEIRQRVSELQQQIVELKEAAEVQNRPQLDIQHSLNELKQRHSEKRKEKLLALGAVESKTKEREALQQEIDNFTANLSQIEQEKLARLRETADLEEKIKRIESVIETTRNDQFQLKNNIGRIEDGERDLQKELQQIRDQYNRVQENLTTLQSESSNSLLRYGRNMPQVIEAINASKHMFSQMPRGPLGSYINIRDKKWAVAVEGFLGPGLLQAFFVNNRKDNAVLMEILNKHWQGGSKPMIITSKFFSEVHDISRNLARAPHDCVTIYDAIDVADPVVANCIIDQMGIESILLMPSNERAIELMSVAARVPRNCKQGVTVTGDRYYPDPNYKTYASRYKHARYLQVSAADLISQYEENRRDLEGKCQTVQNQYNAVRRDKQEQQAKLNELTTKLEKLRQANLIAKRKFDEHKSSAEPESVNIHSLETELKEIKRSIEQKRVNVEMIEQEMKTIKETIVENEENLKKLRGASKGFEERIEPLERQIMEQGEKKNDLNVNENFEKKRLQECKNRLQLARSEMLQKQNVVDEQIEHANAVGERVEEVRKVPDIVNCINDTQRSIRRLESEVESPEETKKKYEVANFKYQQASEIMMSLCDNIEQLQTAVMNRSKHYNCTKDYFITLLDHNFVKVLQFRQFRGNLRIDMDEKKLDLVVIPQQGSQGHTATANLSGGERSFSTVAFLYALWQCMEFPFYFLDEFDVFMDTVNRTKVMDILIHHAKSRPDVQFVFLTPQDVSFITDDSVAIHRLEDPEHRAVQ